MQPVPVGAALDELMEAAGDAALAGARVALSWRERAEFLQVEEKEASDDLVSQADTDAEREIRALLAERRPDDAVLGEESGAAAGTSGIQWFVDPIDGTTNYLYGRAEWAVSVAAATAEGELLAAAVAEPATGALTLARRGGGTWAGSSRAHCRTGVRLERALVEVNFGRPAQRQPTARTLEELLPLVRDVRRGGSAAVALAQVATGRADAYWGPGLQPWDAAAGLLLVHEAGGEVGGLDGRTDAVWPEGGDVLATAPGLWEPLHALLS